MKKVLLSIALAAALGSISSAHAEDNRPIEEIFNAHCSTCHIQGLAGSPKFTDSDAWASRIETGIDAMTQTVITGKGAMPKNGTCFRCTDDQIRLLVEHTVSVVEGN